MQSWTENGFVMFENGKMRAIFLYRIEKKSKLLFINKNESVVIGKQKWRNHINVKRVYTIFRRSNISCDMIFFCPNEIRRMFIISRCEIWIHILCVISNSIVRQNKNINA